MPHEIATLALSRRELPRAGLHDALEAEAAPTSSLVILTQELSSRQMKKRMTSQTLGD